MATTINSYSVSLSLNTEGVVHGGKLARSEISQLKTMLRGMKTEADQFNDGVDLINRALDEQKINIKQHQALLESLYATYDKVSRAKIISSGGIVRRTSGDLDAELDATGRGISGQLAAIKQEKIKQAAEARVRTEAMLDRQLREGISIRRSVMTADEHHAETMRKMQRLLRNKVIDQETYNRVIQKSIGLTYQASAAEQKAFRPGLPPGMVGGTASSLGRANLGSAIGQLGGMYGAYQLGKEIISAHAELETAQVTFEVLLRSASQAKDMLAEFRRLDVESPLGMTDFAKSTQLLLGYGVASEKVIPLVEGLSKASLGNSDRFYWLSKAFADVSAKGRLMAQELNQMTNQGFNPLEHIAKRLNVSMAEMPKLMSEGRVSFDMLTQALMDYTTGAGRVANINERLLNTTQGQFNKMASNLKLTAVEIGGAVNPIVMETMKNANELANYLKSAASLAKPVFEGWAFASAVFAGKGGSFLDARQVRLMNEAAKAAEDLGGAVQSMPNKPIDEMLGGENGAAVEEASEFYKTLEEINQKYQEMRHGAEAIEEIKLRTILTNKDLTEHEKLLGEKALQQFHAIRQAAEQTERDRESQRVRDEEKRHYEEMKRTAEEIQERLNPAAGVARVMRELRELLQANMISVEEYNAEIQRAADNAASVNASGGSQGNPGIIAGTQEAARFLAEQSREKNNQQLKILERQRVIQEAQLLEQRMLNQKIGNLAGQPVEMVK